VGRGTAINHAALAIIPISLGRWSAAKSVPVFEDPGSSVCPLNPKIKLTYVSGYTDHAPLHRGLPDEDTPFLSKPCTRQELL